MLSSAKEGSSSDRLLRLLSRVPGIRQVASELHALQRRTSSADKDYEEDEKEEDKEEDRKDFISSHPLDSAFQFHSPIFPDGHEMDAEVLYSKEKQEEEKEDVEMEKEGLEIVQVEREEEMKKEGEELGDIEEERNEREEAVESAMEELELKRKKMEEEKTEKIEEETMKKTEKMDEAEFKIRIGCAAKHLEPNSKLKPNSPLTDASGTDQKHCLSRLKALDLVHKDFPQNLKRSNRDSEMLRQNLDRSHQVSTVLNGDLIGSTLVSTVLAKRFNG